MSHGSSKQGLVAALTLIACTLAACGGGGGGTGAAGPPPPPPPSPTLTVGGSISGLSGSVRLQNAGGAPLSVSANGPFTFAGTVAAGSSYSVTVTTQPELQTCTVANGSGTASANVTNITVSCADVPPALRLSLQAIKTFRFDWTAAPDGTRYKLFEAPANSDFTQLGADIDASITSFDHIVPLHRRVNARYRVQACAATRCIDSNIVTASGSLADAVGYFKAANVTASDEFGSSVALSADGTTLAVGVPFEDSNGSDPTNEDTRNSGAVYVFVRDRAGPAWEQQAYLKAANPAEDDVFGSSVALDSSGSTLAVGAPLRNGTASDSGAVYVFERSDDGVWTEPMLLEASNAGQGDQFGGAVALSDQGQLAVGARNEDSDDGGPNEGAPNSGAVYVFVREAAGQVTWREDDFVKGGTVFSNDLFGTSVALSRDGTILAVGAISDNDLALNSGAVHVYTHNGQWEPRDFLKASNAEEDDQFGISLALSTDGSTLAVGAIGEDSAATGVNNNINQDDNEAPAAGAAYVFARTGDDWEQQAYIKASDTTGSQGPGGDRFGSSLALSDDGSTLAVGAPQEDSAAIGISGVFNGAGGEDRDNSAGGAGAVYAFERSNGLWAQRAYVKPSNTLAEYVFGVSIALSGDGATLAAGATSEPGSDSGVDAEQNSPPLNDAGAVYLY